MTMNIPTCGEGRLCPGPAMLRMPFLSTVCRIEPVIFDIMSQLRINCMNDTSTLERVFMVEIVWLEISIRPKPGGCFIRHN